MPLLPRPPSARVGHQHANLMLAAGPASHCRHVWAGRASGPRHRRHHRGALCLLHRVCHQQRHPLLPHRGVRRGRQGERSPGPPLSRSGLPAARARGDVWRHAVDGRLLALPRRPWTVPGQPQHPRHCCFIDAECAMVLALAALLSRRRWPRRWACTTHPMRWAG